MTTERLEEILRDKVAKWDGDNALQGLNIIAKYFPDKTVLTQASHDLIYSVPVEDLAEVITEEDAEKLASLNWMTQYESLACFI